MEDSSWEGWTTPPSPEGFALGYPEGRKLPGGPPGAWVGQFRTMSKATDDTIKYAARIWPQVQAEDFERDGRRYVERATGIEYDLCHGNPMLSDNADVADVFFAEDDALWFLRRSDRSQVQSKWIGSMGAIRPVRSQVDVEAQLVARLAQLMQTVSGKADDPDAINEMRAALTATFERVVFEPRWMDVPEGAPLVRGRDLASCASREAMWPRDVVPCGRVFPPLPT